MRDYKPTIQPSLKATRRQLFRKLSLFVVIAVGASVFFYFQGETLTEAPVDAVNPVATSSLALPDPAQTRPLALPAEPVSLPVAPPGSLTQTTQVLPDEAVSPALGEEGTATPLAAAEASALDEISKPDTIDTADLTENLPGMSATWESHTIKSGDSLANIFKEWQLSPGTLHKIVNSSKQAKSLADIHPGETLKLLRDDNGGLLELVLVRSPTESLVISLNDDDGYDTEIVKRDVDVTFAFASGSIESSLFVDGQQAGLTDAQIMEMAGIFGWDIDFALELRKGDTFKLLYEEHFLDGEKLRNGPILAAEFFNDGKLYRAVRYTTPDGITSYFDPDDGRNKKRTFIRTPVKFARISSGFTTRRFHPVLKKWRSHRGVDYAAPTGTPVKATGNGKVIFRGTKGGYGKTVIIQHGAKYTTLYAHLSKYAKSSKKGRTVNQGQIIGYVGKTGLATGPHLHYEFRVDGVHRNPLTVKLPKADPIDKQYRPEFERAASDLLAKFDLFDQQQQQLAQAKKPSNDG